MVSRAGRVSKKYVGTGLSRRMTANSENWAVARGITRKTTVVSENNFADLTKPSLQNVYRLVLTKVQFIYIHKAPRKTHPSLFN